MDKENQKSSPNPRRMNKPLLRALNLTLDDKVLVARKFGVKRFYVKKIKYHSYFSLVQKSSFAEKNLFKNRKLLRYLKFFQVNHFSDYLFEALKVAKSLVHFKNVCIFQVPVMENPHLKLYLKRLPNSVQKIKLQASFKKNIQYRFNLRKIYRSLGSLKHLKCLKENFSGILNYQYKEFDLMRQYLSRLPNLVKIGYKFEDHKGFSTVFTNNKLYPEIRKLHFGMSNLYGKHFRLGNPPQEKKDLNVKAPNVTITCLNFNQFPYLTDLTLTNVNICFLDQFLISQFSGLKSLQRLELLLYMRPQKSLLLFKALMQLPLLDKFILDTILLESDEWNLLGDFLTKQNKLSLLSLIIKRVPKNESEYLLQNTFIEGMHSWLCNKPNLSSLKLNTTWFSLDSVSKCLSQTSFNNQLRFLSVEAAENQASSQDASELKLNELCKFIKNQKDSLSELEIKISLILNDNTINKMLDAVAELTQLKRLEVSLNHGFYSSELLKILPGLDSKLIDYNNPSIKRSFQPNFSSIIKRLEFLDDFGLNLNVRNRVTSFGIDWLIPTIRVLSSLKTLRRLGLYFSVADVSLENREKLADALLDLENVKDLEVRLTFDKENISIYLNEAIDYVGRRQSLRQDLMFTASKRRGLNL